VFKDDRLKDENRQKTMLSVSMFQFRSTPVTFSAKQVYAAETPARRTEEQTKKEEYAGVCECV
jgi:hypothetical protein